jgi:hypothetical protein
VVVFDPLGDDFTPTGKPGPANGYVIKASVLALPFEEFVKVFNGINYEDQTTERKY